MHAGDEVQRTDYMCSVDAVVCAKALGLEPLPRTNVLYLTNSTVDIAAVEVFNCLNAPLSLVRAPQNKPRPARENM